MSYLMKRRRAQAIRRGRKALFGFGDDDNAVVNLAGVGAATTIMDALSGRLSNNADQLACLAQADTQTKNIDGIVQKIAQQWKPSGNFTVADLNTASSAVYQMLEEAKIAVIVAPNSASDRDTMVNQALDDITKYENRGIPFQQAVVQAKAQGIGYVTTEGFKDWVLGALVAASAAFATRSVLDCNVTWLENAWNFAQQVASAVLSIVETVADDAVDAGVAVVHAASTVVTNAKYIIYGGIALGALYLYQRYFKTSTHAV